MNYNEKQMHIISVAEKLFASKGFDGTSIRDIAENAGVNLAMISYYFGSKEKLMQTIFEERTKQVKLRLEKLVNDEQLSPMEKIFILADEYIERYIEKQQFYRIMVCEQMLQKNQVITDLMNGLKRQNAELFDQIIREGQKRKEFKPAIDVVLILNTMTGMVMHTFVHKDYYRLYHNLQSLSDEEFHSLLKEKLSNYLKVLFKSMLVYEA